MNATALDWQPQSLQRQMAPLMAGLQVQAVASLGSSNTELLERARREPDMAPCLLVAEQQTAGRGRQGKVWWSQAGASLTFSLALPLAPADWSGLSLAVGLVLAEALDPARPGQPPRLGIKWPNDLLLREANAGTDSAELGPPGRKLGGILIETVASGGRRWAVVGVGLNLRPRPAELEAKQPLPWGHADLQSLHPGISAPQLLAKVAPPLLQALIDFERAGFAPLCAAFARRDLLAGRRLSTTGAGADAPTEGLADGVDSQGVLWLRNASGRHAVRSGELSLRLSADASPPTVGSESGAC